MGRPVDPPKVKYFITALSAHRVLLEEIYHIVQERFGVIEEAGPLHSWDFSPAYTQELGNAIRRRFFVFRDLSTPERLPDWKLATIDIEGQFLSCTKTLTKRRINLDPGYVSGSQVILASTKRFNNRVYLRDGIYGDLTLYFDGRTLQKFAKLTLPDYRTGKTIQFFNQVRRRLLQQLVEGPRFFHTTTQYRVLTLS